MRLVKGIVKNGLVQPLEESLPEGAEAVVVLQEKLARRDLARLLQLGPWEDDRTTNEIIHDIYASRVQHHAPRAAGAPSDSAATP